MEAYLALRLAGDGAGAAHMRHASDVIRDLGGVERTRVFTRMWLSLLGLWSWEQVPALPPEQILLPARAPLSTAAVMVCRCVRSRSASAAVIRWAALRASRPSSGIRHSVMATASSGGPHRLPRAWSFFHVWHAVQ